MSLGNEHSYYDLLEVAPGAGDEQIWDAYQRMRSFYSSDPQFRQEFSEAEAVAIISLLDEAYETLSDPTRRQAYDRAIARVWPPETQNQRAMPDFIEDEDAAIVPSETPQARPHRPSVDEIQRHYPIPKTGVDGHYMRTLREDAGLSSDELSAITRIAVHHIDSIETDHIDKLPAPVFVRGFIIQIAKTFGLNEKVVTDSYMERFKRLRTK